MAARREYWQYARHAPRSALRSEAPETDDKKHCRHAHRDNRRAFPRVIVPVEARRVIQATQLDGREPACGALETPPAQSDVGCFQRMVDLLNFHRLHRLSKRHRLVEGFVSGQRRWRDALDPTWLRTSVEPNPWDRPLGSAFVRHPWRMPGLPLSWQNGGSVVWFTPVPSKSWVSVGAGQRYPPR